MLDKSTSLNQYQRERIEYQRQLEKTLNNCISKMPCYLNPKYSFEGVTIEDSITHKKKIFTIDYDKHIKAFVFEIREWCKENIFPILVQEKVVERDYTPEEIFFKIKEENKTIEDFAFEKKKIYQLKKFKLVKAIEDKNLLIVENLQKGTQKAFQMKMPVSTFVKCVLTKWNSQYAFTEFLNKSQYLYKLDDRDNNRNHLEDENNEEVKGE